MVVIKKRQILCVIAIILVAVILAFSVEGTLSAVSQKSSFCVVIDAGHGGIDGGATGKNTKVRESHLNLLISQKLQHYFLKANTNVVMTRKTEDGLYGIASRGFKSRDMRKRKEIINNANPDFVISIHQNRYSNSSRRGIQVFYSDNGNKLTKSYAEYMQNYLNDTMNYPTLKRRYSCQNGDFYIVKCSKAPTIIIECGYLSNATDEKMLLTDSYQNELANNIFSATISFLNEINYEKIDFMQI